MVFIIDFIAKICIFVGGGKWRKVEDCNFSLHSTASSKDVLQQSLHVLPKPACSRQAGQLLKILI
jgi:hypothetical protein